eukprot:2527186-Amphidinium_carterae.1
MQPCAIVYEHARDLEAALLEERLRQNGPHNTSGVSLPTILSTFCKNNQPTQNKNAIPKYQKYMFAIALQGLYGDSLRQQGNPLG